MVKLRRGDTTMPGKGMLMGKQSLHFLTGRRGLLSTKKAIYISLIQIIVAFVNFHQMAW